MVSNFELLDLEQPDGLSRLVAFFNSLSEQGTRPSSEIVRLIRRQKCRSIIIERNYIDKDYKDEFAHFYSLTLKPHKGVCTRLHFFSCKLSGSDFSRLGSLNEHYIGYCIVRPTSGFRVSRTVIRPFEEGIGNSYFVLCKAQYEANIKGQKLVVEGAPFIQQDTQVAACAQASLWMALRYMSKKIGLPVKNEEIEAEKNGFISALAAVIALSTSLTRLL